ncbi:MAG: hypothetical protein K6E27_04725 [Eubacterium sp.]|nr:hypothetical protein [Eubacterium sp.]
MSRFNDIIKELSVLPKGTVVYKKIKGKEQPYLQWSEKGKTKSRYIKKDEREQILAMVEKRLELKAELDRLCSEIMPEEDLIMVRETFPSYKKFVNDQALISKKSRNNEFFVNRKLINSKAYYDKFTKISVKKEVYESIYREAGRLLEMVDGKNVERMCVINARTGEMIVNNYDREAFIGHTYFNKEEYRVLESCLDYGIVMHNHPSSRPPSGRDIATYAISDNIKSSLVLCHDGDVFEIVKAVYEVAEIYEALFDKYAKLFGKENARTLAILKMEELNVNNKLYEVRRL